MRQACPPSPWPVPICHDDYGASTKTSTADCHLPQSASLTAGFFTLLFPGPCQKLNGFSPRELVGGSVSLNVKAWDYGGFGRKMAAALSPSSETVQVFTAFSVSMSLTDVPTAVGQSVLCKYTIH